MKLQMTATESFRLQQYKAGLTTTQIAEAEGCTRQAVHKSLKRIGCSLILRGGVLRARKQRVDLKVRAEINRIARAQRLQEAIEKPINPVWLTRLKNAEDFEYGQGPYKGGFALLYRGAWVGLFKTRADCKAVYLSLRDATFKAIQA